MDRLTGKTMDCYIEFFSVGDAQAAVNAKTRLGNIHKLGDRVAEISMSSQDELLKVLFPKAKQVEWDSGVPLIMETDEPFNSGFKSFVTKEELVMLVKHAEFPQRVSAPLSLYLSLHGAINYRAAYLAPRHHNWPDHPSEESCCGPTVNPGTLYGKPLPVITGFLKSTSLPPFFLLSFIPP